MALLLELPSRTTFENLSSDVDPITIFNKKKDLMKRIGLGLQEIFS